MTNYITNSQQQELTSSVRMAVQQKTAKVAPTFVQASYRGAGAQVADYLKVAPAPQKNRASKSDTTYYDIDTLRRWIYPNTYNFDMLVDQFDKLRTLNDPTNMYQKAIITRMATTRDDECISAFFAVSTTGVNSGSTVTFPSTQVVAVTVGGGGNPTGLNVQKLQAARQILQANQVDMDNETIYCVISSFQDRNLQNEIQVNNRDYNAQYDIATGKLKSLYGINFVYCERLQYDGNGYMRVPMYAQSGMQFGIWEDITTMIYDKVATKNNNAQISAEQMIGATRLEEEKVVEIKCSVS